MHVVGVYFCSVVRLLEWCMCARCLWDSADCVNFIYESQVLWGDVIFTIFLQLWICSLQWFTISLFSSPALRMISFKLCVPFYLWSPFNMRSPSSFLRRLDSKCRRYAFVGFRGPCLCSCCMCRVILWSFDCVIRVVCGVIQYVGVREECEQAYVTGKGAYRLTGWEISEVSVIGFSFVVCCICCLPR